MVRGEGLHTNPTSPSPSGFPSLRSCLDSHRELIYVREKKAHETSPGIQFAICRVLSGRLPLTSFEDSAQDSTGRGQYCTLFDRTCFFFLIKKTNDVSKYISIFLFSFFLSFSPSLSIREVIHDYSYIMIWQSEMSVSLTQVRNKMYRCWNYKFINSIRSQALKRLYSLSTSRAADPQDMFHASPPHF